MTLQSDGRVLEIRILMMFRLVLSHRGYVPRSTVRLFSSYRMLNRVRHTKKLPEYLLGSLIYELDLYDEESKGKASRIVYIYKHSKPMAILHSQKGFNITATIRNLRL